MSIHALIDEALTQKSLVNVEAFEEKMIVRRIIATPDVNNLFVGPWEDTEWEERCGHLVRQVDIYLNGERITVSKDPYAKDDSYMKRLDPAASEIWELRSRAPIPGIRVFGRFAVKDTFVALDWKLRKDLGERGDREWQLVMENCQRLWKKYFFDILPRSGDLHDYLTNAVYV